MTRYSCKALVIVHVELVANEEQERIRSELDMESTIYMVRCCLGYAQVSALQRSNSLPATVTLWASCIMGILHCGHPALCQRCWEDREIAKGETSINNQGKMHRLTCGPLASTRPCTPGKTIGCKTDFVEWWETGKTTKFIPQRIYKG